jgi:hypothetical protein
MTSAFVWIAGKTGAHPLRAHARQAAFKTCRRTRPRCRYLARRSKAFGASFPEPVSISVMNSGAA